MNRPSKKARVGRHTGDDETKHASEEPTQEQLQRAVAAFEATPEAQTACVLVGTGFTALPYKEATFDHKRNLKLKFELNERTSELWLVGCSIGDMARGAVLCELGRQLGNMLKDHADKRVFGAAMNVNVRVNSMWMAECDAMVYRRERALKSILSDVRPGPAPTLMVDVDMFHRGTLEQQARLTTCASILSVEYLLGLKIVTPRDADGGYRACAVLWKRQCHKTFALERIISFGSNEVTSDMIAKLGWFGSTDRLVCPSSVQDKLTHVGAGPTLIELDATAVLGTPELGTSSVSIDLDHVREGLDYDFK